MNIRAGALAAVQGLGLALLAIPASLLLFVLSVVLIAVPFAGVFLLPPLTQAVRGHADLRRRMARTWLGTEIARPYRPAPRPRGGLIGVFQRYRRVITDPATWRDLLWLPVDASAGFTLAILAFALPLWGLYGVVLAAGVWEPIVHAHAHVWYTFLPIRDGTSGRLAGLLGLVYTGAGLWLAAKVIRLHAEITRGLLAPTRERALELRVARLTESRADALDTQAAELRRIERDLHDGAQARLVAMGMSLGAIEHLMDSDPDQARLLLAEARESSAKALTELRDLVRGIHPPVLAERGLGDAVRALALASPLRTEVTVELPGRLEAPVESAAYFAVSEVLTNAAKHAEARRAWIDLRHEEGLLRVTVTDDGRGGADPARGTGLRGVERRLGTFDGVLAVSSPEGGPTIVTMELPCVLASPRP